MNVLPIEKRIQIINCLVEGMSMRATSRIADVSINTVSKLLVDVGEACEKFHNKMVQNIKVDRVQCDEIWSFVCNKEKNVPEGMEDYAGDIWTWTALDIDSKLIVSWFVGKRDFYSATEFLMDVKSRLVNRVQLTTDGLKPYLMAVDNAFDGDVDYAMLVKIYGHPEGQRHERKYSAVECIGAEKKTISGNSNGKFVSTSYVERQNLTIRRFARLTNAFSKKIENHCYAIVLHLVYYNFVKIHKSLRVTPAMQAGLMKKPMTLADIINLVPEEIPKKRGSYKKERG